MLDPTRAHRANETDATPERDTGPHEGDALASAFAGFYARYFAPVHAMARKCTASEHQAQLLTETIMIRALDCFSPDRPTEDLDADVFRIARDASCGRTALCDNTGSSHDH